MPDDTPTTSPSGFLDEDNGNHSSMRLMCLMSLVAAIGYAVMVKLGRYEMNQYDMIIFIGFLTGAFAPKAVQKFAETTCVTKQGTSGVQ